MIPYLPSWGWHLDIDIKAVQAKLQPMPVSGLQLKSTRHYLILNFLPDFGMMVPYLSSRGWHQEINATQADLQLMSVSGLHPESISDYFVLNFIYNDFLPAF
jgi:hypothetical protein